MSQYRVRHWMSPNPLTISPQANVYDAYKLMTERRIRHLPVMQGTSLIGILTLGDIREFKPSEATILNVFDIQSVLSNLNVEQAMTLSPLVISPEAPIQEAARLMLERKIGGLPVVENDRLVGIVTESDVLRALIRQLAHSESARPPVPIFRLQLIQVSQWMTPNPITIDLQTKLSEADALMHRHRVRRLPVVAHGRLVGIVTLGDLRGAQPSPATALGTYERNYLMTRLTADQIMTHNPISIAPAATLYEAASLLLAHKIGGLPVIDDSKLVGILTESDIFRAVIQGAANAQLDEQGATPTGN